MYFEDLRRTFARAFAEGVVTVRRGPPYMGGVPAHNSTPPYDLDRPLAADLPHFDVVVHFGVLYHLERFEENLVDIATHCDCMLPEAAREGVFRARTNRWGKNRD
jgi:hypothetical protein